MSYLALALLAFSLQNDQPPEIPECYLTGIEVTEEVYGDQYIYDEDENTVHIFCDDGTTRKEVTETLLWAHDVTETTLKFRKPYFPGGFCPPLVEQTVVHEIIDSAVWVTYPEGHCDEDTCPDMDCDEDECCYLATDTWMYDYRNFTTDIDISYEDRTCPDGTPVVAEIVVTKTMAERCKWYDQTWLSKCVDPDVDCSVKDREGQTEWVPVEMDRRTTVYMECTPPNPLSGGLWERGVGGEEPGPGRWPGLDKLDDTVLL